MTVIRLAYVFGIISIAVVSLITFSAFMVDLKRVIIPDEPDVISFLRGDWQ